MIQQRQIIYHHRLVELLGFLKTALKRCSVVEIKTSKTFDLEKKSIR